MTVQNSELLPMPQALHALTARGTHCGYGQLWRLAHQNAFPIVRVGGRIFIQTSNLDAAEHAVKTYIGSKRVA